MTVEYVCWGIHPRLGAEPFKLEIGSLRDCKAEQAQRERDGGWTMLGIWLKGDRPVLRDAHDDDTGYHDEAPQDVTYLEAVLEGADPYAPDYDI